MADKSEVWTAVLDALKADAALAALLASAAALYYEEGELPAAPEYPLIVLKVLSDLPNPNLGCLGDYTVRFDLKIQGTDQTVLRQIDARMESLLEIPRSRTTVIQSDGFTVRRLRHLGTVAAGTVAVRKDGVRVHQLNADYEGTVTIR